MLYVVMRGIILLIFGILLFGCVDPDTSNGNTTVIPSGNTSNNCTGPVCGVDDETYSTDCEADKAQIAVDYAGECGSELECIDSDNGIDMKSAGTTSKGEVSSKDYCVDSKNVVEFLCVENSIVNTTISCGKDELCEDGKCIEEIVQEEQPSTDCKGPFEPNLSIRETVTVVGMNYTDICVDYKVVKDYYCKDNHLQSINNECAPGYGCKDGICSLMESSCTETDEGKDSKIRGKTTVSRGFFLDQPMIDECVDEGILTEYYCLEDGTMDSEELLCGTGRKCSEGRCVRSECTDSDGGIDPYIRGIVKVGAEEIEYEDNCVNTEKLQEYFCYGDGAQSETIRCEDGYTCSQDECVKES